MNFSHQKTLIILFLVLEIFTTTEKEVTLMVLPPPQQQQHSPVDVHQQNLHQDQQLSLPTNFILLCTLILC